MQVTGTPSGQNDILTTEFEGRMLTVHEPSAGKITISFDDIGQRFRYEVKEHVFGKVNYKTVVAGLKGTHPQIISAKFDKKQGDVHVLTVKVAYQYLPEITEEFTFNKIQIPAEQSEQAAIRGMRSVVRNIREQLNTIGSVQVLQGNLDKTADTQLFIRLSHKHTVFTWGLNLKGLNNNVIKPQMYYYNSVTKQRKSSNACPDSGVYVHHAGKSYVEIKFLAEYDDFDMVIFQLQGANKGDYTLSSEKVESASA